MVLQYLYVQPKGVAVLSTNDAAVLISDNLVITECIPKLETDVKVLQFLITKVLQD